MTPRDYGQHCGLARALDLLGERWTLLVVRELSLGPKRYGDLLDALPGVGTNLLAARLKSLEGAGLVCRAKLPPPANVRVYELAESGEELRPIVEALALWGLRLLPDEPGERETRAAWAALSMAAAARGTDRAAGPVATVELRVGEELFWARVGDGEATVRHGSPPADADAALTCPKHAFFALATRRATLEQLDGGGELEVSGDRGALERTLDALHLPTVGEIERAEGRRRGPGH